MSLSRRLLGHPLADAGYRSLAGRRRDIFPPYHSRIRLNPLAQQITQGRSTYLISWKIPSTCSAILSKSDNCGSQPLRCPGSTTGEETEDRPRGKFGPRNDPTTCPCGRTADTSLVSPTHTDVSRLDSTHGGKADILVVHALFEVLALLEMILDILWCGDRWQLYIHLDISCEL